MSEEEKRQLIMKTAACFVGAFVILVLGFTRGSVVDGWFSQASVPLSKYLRCEVNAPLIAISIAMVWAAVGSIFIGRISEAKLQALTQAKQNQKDQQRQEFADDVARIQRSNTERQIETQAGYEHSETTLQDCKQ